MRIGRGVLAVLGAAMSLCGCAREPKISDRQTAMVEASRTFSGETRERVIEAAEKVLRASDPDDFEFSERLNGFEGRRHWMIYLVLSSAVGIDKWDFQTEEIGHSLRASVSVSIQAQGSSRYSHLYVDVLDNKIALYRLFWARVDYVLGRSTHWPTCEEAWDEQDAKGFNRTAIDSLCGLTNDGRTAPPPAPLKPVTRSKD